MSGANIGEMNTVRKHLSAIKGGRLAVAAQPARVLAWLISDVPNDDLSVIASGPTVPDPTTRQDALAVIAKYKIDAPAAVLLLSEGGAVVHASALARSLLDNRCGLRLRHDRLWHPSPSVLDHLAKVMATTLHTGCRAKMTVSLAWGETLSLDMAPANPQLFPSDAPLVFVRMRRNSARKQADADNLITAFEITKTEAKVLAGLVAGLAPSELAAQNGVSEHTVRSHITSMKGKMQCNRIVDLVKLAVLV